MDSVGQGVPAALFDVDGTLAASNLVYAYLDFRLYRRPLLYRYLWLASILPKLVYYAFLDLRSRSRFNEVFYRNYAGVSLKEMEGWAQGAVKRFWEPRMLPEALQQLQEHRAQGHRIVIVSGGMALTLEPLARWLEVDACASAWAEVDGDRLTGRLAKGALSGEAKAVATHEVAEQLGLDLAQSYAYADSYADREFLECVGHPVVVNPDRRLRRLAGQRGWPIRIWRRQS